MVENSPGVFQTNNDGKLKLKYYRILALRVTIILTAVGMRLDASGHFPLFAVQRIFLSASHMQSWTFEQCLRNDD